MIDQESNESLVLSDEELSLVDEALKSMELGKKLTAEEVRDLARKRTKAWLEADHKDLTA